MGSSPSKQDREETVSKVTRKKEASSTPETNTASSYDGDEESMLSASQDMSAIGKKMLQSMSTPRTNPATVRANANYGAQSRVDRQLASNGAANGSSERRDDVAQPSYIADDQVHVNLAMADLMAYLQVVANNSNNLPLTRRDDPELGRMVSSLTPEEYARKSAAFVPADVRVIGGTFTKYGRVWDLPTSDEYNASDGAQEPGRSYGGACSNAMLKVLYDAANEAADAAQTLAASEALFDDDDDESLSNPIDLNRNSTFASLDMGDHANPSTLTWANLLRKMKAEMKDIGYAQAPTITSTRKFDLNQPFSFVPDSFDPENGKKRSLLIGCNYLNIHGAELKASHDDVRSMKDYIVNVHGFTENQELMTILIDDDDHKHPTHLNITEAFKALSEQSQPGDAVFIQFSGHGGRVLDSPVDADAESYDEVIVPSDYATSGLIRDTLIFKTLLAPMRYGVTVTVLIDCCDTGTMLDLPYSWSTRSDRPESLAKMTYNEDFSYVRFLKVVKTLYESSTFTQLGKTVGSALTVQPPLSTKDNAGLGDGEDDTCKSTVQNDDEDLTHNKQSTAQSSLMTVLTACTSPANSISRSKSPDKSSRKNNRDLATVDTRDTRNPTSLLEQVMNCTYVHGDDPYSDEDTYPSGADRSFDNETFEDSTFDSMTDDGYESARRARGRSRRRRRG